MRGAGFFVLLCALALAACGGGGGTSSCAFGLADMPGDQPFSTAGVCREWTGASDQVASRQEDCASLATTTDGGITLQTKFSNGPCPRTNIVGGCRNSYAGVTYTDWYYPLEASNVSEVMALCVSGGMFVPPP